MGCFELAVVGWQLSVVSYRLAVVGYRLSVIGCQLSVVGSGDGYTFQKFEPLQLFTGIANFPTSLPQG
jgi:hypothetical protein